MKRQLLSMLLVCACAFGCMAIPAKNGPVKYTQPDGTVITVTVRGDEFGHMIFSEDGFLLKKANGRLEYAAFDADGVPYPSGIAVAHNGAAGNIASTLQTPAQIEAWTKRLSQNRNEILSKRYSHWQTVGIRSAEIPEDDGSISIDFGKFHNVFPSLGEQKVLVILVEYKDRPFKYGSYDYFDRLLNEEGFSDFGSRGSVRDWLIENSAGLYTPQFDVYGPVQLPKNANYYGIDTIFGTDTRAYYMAIHAMQILDEEVDFSEYDGNGDGMIDNVFIIFSGPADFGDDTVWPHEAFLRDFDAKSEYLFDGVSFQQYACTGEYLYDGVRADGTGTFTHEFSHVLGLPDIYGKGLGMIDAFTPGEWCLLDRGGDNNDGLTPCNYSSYEKAALGWLQFRTLKREETVTLPPLSVSNIAYAMPTDKENEFYFFENRQQVGNDEFLPGHGMLVWHVDYDDRVWAASEINNDATHQRVDIVEADDIKTDGTRAGDAFPGTAGVTEFGFRTNPILASWSGKQLEFDLTDITESEDGIISFRVVDSKNNTGDPGSVENAITDRESFTVPMYDIFGRKILHPAPGQIYFQDGKKLIGK